MEDLYPVKNDSPVDTARVPGMGLLAWGRS